MRNALLENRNDVTTPKKTWSTFVSTYRSFSDPETLCAKIHLLEDERNFDFNDELKNKVDDDFDGISCSNESLSDNEDEWDVLEAAQLLTDVGNIRQFMTNKKEEKDVCDRKKRHTEEEWRMMAVILDRLFFIIYIIVNTIGLLAIFMRVMLPG